MVGLEPTHHIMIKDFKSFASTIPPHRYIPIEGLEPSYFNKIKNFEFLVSTIPPYRLFREEGLEPSTFYTQNKRSTY